MFAAVDLGSNSFRLHIGMHAGGALRSVKSARDPVRLGAGLDRRGFLTESAIQAALASLQRFKAILKAYPLHGVRVVATNTLRIAKNASALLPLAERAIGYPIEVLSGEQEGRLIYKGVAHSLGDTDERRLVLDIGGGSTELILGSGPEVEWVESFGVGTVRQSLSFFPDGCIDAASFEAAIASARHQFADLAAHDAGAWDAAYGTSGTIRAIGEAIVRNALGDGRVSAAGLEALKQRLIRFGHTDRIELAGVKPERALSVVGGVAILSGLMQELGIGCVTPLDAGLRIGVLWDMHASAARRDQRAHSIQRLLHTFQPDRARAEQVAALAASLHQQWKPQASEFAQLLNWAGLAHEIGRAQSESGYHKHAAYLLEHADLPGFGTAEQRRLSQLVLGQKGNLRKVAGALRDPEFAKALLALRIAVASVHLGMAPPAAALGWKMKGRIELEFGRNRAWPDSLLAEWLAKERGFWSQAGIECSAPMRR